MEDTLSFLYSVDQLKFKKSFIEYYKKELHEYVIRQGKEGFSPHKFWKKCAASEGEFYPEDFEITKSIADLYRKMQGR